MCNIIPKFEDSSPVQTIYSGDTMVIGKESCRATNTRTPNGYALICKHADGEWELTPVLKDGELLEIPAGSKIKVVKEDEWKEMNGINPSPV